MRLVIYTHEGKTLQFNDVQNVNKKSDKLYFEIVGYKGDKGQGFFDNIAGYVVYNEEVK